MFCVDSACVPIVLDRPGRLPNRRTPSCHVSHEPNLHAWKTTMGFLHLTIPGYVDAKLRQAEQCSDFGQECVGTRINPFAAGIAAFS